MFEIMTSQASVVNRARYAWHNHGHTSSDPMPRVLIPSPLKYPCLSMCAVSNGVYLPPSKTLQPECFTLVFCEKKDAKRLIYPSTNRDRGGHPYTFVNSKEDIIAHMKAKSREGMDYKSEEQDMVRRRFAEYLDRLVIDEFPCLIKHKVYYIKTSRVLDFFVVRKSRAKQLVYWNKDMRNPTRAKPITKLGDIDTDYVIFVGIGGPSSVTIDVGLARGQVMRFRHDIEEEVRDRERERIEIHNTRLSRNIHKSRTGGSRVSDDHLNELAKKEIADFGEWRKTYRSALSDRYPTHARGVGPGIDAQGADLGIAPVTNESAIDTNTLVDVLQTDEEGRPI